MIRRKPLSLAVRRAVSSVAFAAAAASIPSLCQAQGILEEIVVTGSRIQITDPNLVTSSPVIQVDADEFTFHGVTRAEDLLNTLPQLTPERSQGQSNGATGTATLDLRGLGSSRTLVLINGHRLGLGDPFVLAPDINQVPATLIERVELLTGGASSTYGSDALAGVVNFIMKKDFQGVQFDYQYSAYQHYNGNKAVQASIAAHGFQQAPEDVWDGDTHNLSIVVGTNSEDGKGNVTAYAGYRDTAAVLQSSRDFSACTLQPGPEPTCGGSFTDASGSFSDFATFLYTVNGRNFIPATDQNLYNFGPSNYYQRPDIRYTAGVFDHYELNGHLQAYSEFQVMDDRSLAQVAPSGDFFETSTLNCDNPYLSTQQRAAVRGLGPGDANGDGVIEPGEVVPGVTPCAPGVTLQGVYIGRRNVEGGPRYDDLRHIAYRILGGIKGKLIQDWTYDAYANFARTLYNESYHNELSITRMRRALDVVPDPNTGQPVCQSVIDGTDPACVPWNIFQTGGVSQAALNYLTLQLFSKAQLSQDQFVAYVNGDLTRLGVVSPMAGEGVKLVLGGEYRHESLDYQPDQGFQSGDGAGQGTPILPVSGNIQVSEFFFETHIPLVQDRPWIKSLSTDAGYRYSNYNTGFSTHTFKAIGEWMPFGGLKFRGGYSRAVRAPNINELFTPRVSSGWGGIDPCAGEYDPNNPELSRPLLTQAQCANTGVTAGQYGHVRPSPFDEYNGVFGGEPKLDAETSDSFTVGVVLTPEEYVPGLQFSVDYWSINLSRAISSFDGQFVVTQCALTGDPTLCGLIHRSPINGSLWIGSGNFVQLTKVNIGFFDVAGIDFVGSYYREVGRFGSLNFTFRGTFLDHWDLQQIPSGPIYQCAGKWGGTCVRPRPVWKHNVTGTWISPWNFSCTATWRYVGAVDNADGYFNPGERQYVDLAVSWTPGFIGFDGTTVNLGVNNIADNDPPVSPYFGLVSPFGNGNTIPGAYDYLGRYVFFGVSQKF